MGDVTLIIDSIKAGNTEASTQLLPLVYDELRRLAGHKLAQEPPGQTLQPTALVHEAYLRLVGAKGDSQWDGRSHFFAAAAEAMRRILVENARGKRRHKRGGRMVRRELEEADVLAPEPAEDVLALDESLTELAKTDRLASDIVQLRYFGGLSIADAAEVLGVSVSTAKRIWTYARTWLYSHLKDAGEASTIS
jgi:RNA polymerase sigma factor (TIGR02999 family)